MHPKNIVFDLGGVLININYQRTIQAFQQLGFPNFEEMYSQFKANRLFEQLETGHISEETFYQTLIHSTQNAITRNQITEAWNAMLLNFRIPSLQFLEKLKPNYNVFLLSNTNIIHKRKFDSILQEQTGLNAIDPLFHKCYYSHLIGLRKPYREVYQFVLDDAGIQANETLFIDDSQPNIVAAQELGIHAHLLKDKEWVEESFDYLISS
ncbi:MAG TPA: HAD family phosphatase [Ferruginibacter sp.]|nr:HAD family phosphatase [Ferruginibacter sp.]HRO17022.1 HAD family phosphatase [Ferruginibacter sp.]HRQ20012.1 HAD family phosphatase [Ferruginibacter sp.]